MRGGAELGKALVELYLAGAAGRRAIERGPPDELLLNGRLPNLVRGGRHTIRNGDQI